MPLNALPASASGSSMPLNALPASASGSSMPLNGSPPPAPAIGSPSATFAMAVRRTVYPLRFW